MPTKLSVSGKNIIILTVEHHVNPAQGQPFIYPVSAGAGWEGGFQSNEVEMPPPELPEEKEEWEELGVKITEAYPYARVSLSAQGPPLARPASNGTIFSHRYKFSECRYQADKLPKVSNPKRREWLITIEGNCMQEKGTDDLLAAMALRGWYWYRPNKEVWTNASEEDCKKWGPYMPAVVHCEAVPRRDPHHVVLYGNFRFQPGTPANFLWVSSCTTLWAVLTVGAPHKHEREPIISAAEEGEFCDWPQR